MQPEVCMNGTHLELLRTQLLWLQTLLTLLWFSQNFGGIVPLSPCFHIWDISLPNYLFLHIWSVFLSCCSWELFFFWGGVFFNFTINSWVTYYFIIHKCVFLFITLPSCYALNVLPKFICWKPIPNVLVFGDGAFEMWLCHEGRGLLNGNSPQRAPLSLSSCETQPEDGIYKLWKGPYKTPNLPMPSAGISEPPKLLEINFCYL